MTRRERWERALRALNMTEFSLGCAVAHAADAARLLPEAEGAALEDVAVHLGEVASLLSAITAGMVGQTLASGSDQDAPPPH